ncbi:hypothetical protein ID0047_09160 [Helicobacter pylori]
MRLERGQSMGVCVFFFFVKMPEKNPLETCKNERHLSNATQKAHAIFYVTKKPTPPQKGE